MPVKIKWGWSDTDNAASANDIDSWEDDGSGGQAYDGDYPRRGVFGFRISRIKTRTSKGGNPTLQVSLRLDPRGRKEHKQYDGCPATDFITITKQTVWKFRPFLDAIGVTGRDFLTKTLADDEGNVISIGGKKINGLLVVAPVHFNEESGYLDVGRYLKPKDDSDDQDDVSDDDGDDAGNDDAPF